MKAHRYLACLVLFAVPKWANAGERVYTFKSVEDSAVTADPAVCAAAPFRVNARLGASLWAYETRKKDGRVVNDSIRQLGTATACLQLTNLTFPPGLGQSFYGRFDLPAGSFTVAGTCNVIANSVPKAGVILAGCSLQVVSAPAEVVGGVATSASVFNPFRLTGFNTGSYWTFHLYDNEPDQDSGSHQDHDKDLELVEDSRSDADIARAQAAAAN